MDVQENKDILDPTTEVELPPPVFEKKGGMLGKVISLLLGFVLGVGGTVGGVAAVAVYVPVQKVASFADIDLTEYLSAEYASQTLFGMAKNLVVTVQDLMKDDTCLKDFEKITPQVDQVADMIVGTIKKFGITLTKDRVMETPLSSFGTYLQEAVYGSYLCDILGEEKVRSNSLMMTLCYGTEGVDYVKNGEKIEMLDGKTPRTLNDLVDFETDGLFDGLYLADFMTVDPDNKLMTYIAYGREGVHYHYDETTGAFVMLQKRIAVDADGKIYNEYGEAITGSIAGDTYTAEDGTVYTIQAAGLPDLTTENKTNAKLYYLFDDKGEPCKYTYTSIGDLTAEDSALNKATSRLTVAELMGEKEVESNSLLKHLGDATVNTLPDKLKELTVQEIMPEQVYMTDADGNFLDKSGNPTDNEDDYVVNRKWWYLLHDEAAHNELGHDSTCEGDCIGEYQIADLGGLVSNMTANMEAATLNQLAEDGMMNLNKSTRDTKVITDIKGVRIEGISDADYALYHEKTLGDLTAKQMLEYTSVIVAALDKLSK